jgi:hypothetical protein
MSVAYARIEEVIIEISEDAARDMTAVQIVSGRIIWFATNATL